MSAPKFLATGRCLPAKVVTNDDLSRTVDTNDEWVFSRTASTPGTSASRRAAWTWRRGRPGRPWSARA